ncbi:MAG: serine/threonine-protein kinase, partial [Candidatus Zixiibacteriota bacterium]
MSDGKDMDGSATSPRGGPDPLGIIGWEVAGKYKIRAYIGGGGFGEVYEGFNMHLPEQKLVFKFFKRVQSRDKFAKEAKILCMLDHPNISRVIDFLPEEGAVVVAYIDGEDGAARLKKSGALDEETFLRVARAMTDAIAFAHEKRIAHRDLKPGNIMFDKSGHVYLIDFGIAKEMGGDATKTAYVALTPLFAAPERQSGEQDYNPFLSDIYEMGVTLFNFATNDLPYRNPANPNIHEWGGMASENLSPELRRILMKATHPDPKQRYQTAREMAGDLKLLKQVYGGGKKKSAAIYYVAAIIVLLAVGGYYFRDRITGLYNQLTAKQEQVNESEQIKTKIDEALKQPEAETPADTTAVRDTTIVSETGKEATVAETSPETKETPPTTT